MMRRMISTSSSIARVGAGYALTASHLYAWDESLDEAVVRGAELGVLPIRRAWRKGRHRGRSPRSASTRRATRA